METESTNQLSRHISDCVPQVYAISPNFTRVYVNGITYFYSYNSLIAFLVRHGDMFVCKRKWSRTTSNHLSILKTGKHVELNEEEFIKLVAMVSSTQVL